MAKPAPQTKDPLEESELSLEELEARAKARKSSGMTPDEIDRLQQTYREVALANDEDAKSIKRAIQAKLRRLTHEELHPDCARVTMMIPWHPTSLPRLGKYIPFKINEKPYQGECELWTCEARQLAWLIEEAKRIESLRFGDNGATIDLDNPVAERIRQIQEA